jgi:hypothetical protein
LRGIQIDVDLIECDGLLRFEIAAEGCERQGAAMMAQAGQVAPTEIIRPGLRIPLHDDLLQHDLPDITRHSNAPGPGCRATRYGDRPGTNQMGTHSLHQLCRGEIQVTRRERLLHLAPKALALEAVKNRPPGVVGQQRGFQCGKEPA